MPISSCYVYIICMGTPGIQFTVGVGFIISGREMGRVNGGNGCSECSLLIEEERKT